MLANHHPPASASAALPLLLLLLLAPPPARADCPDGYWDCLRQLPDGRLLVTGGGFLYGTCLDWWRGGCFACNRKDAGDVEWIRAKCNAGVAECEGQCTVYAVVEECCSPSRQECGNMPPDEAVRRQVCSWPGSSGRGDEAEF